MVGFHISIIILAHMSLDEMITQSMKTGAYAVIAVIAIIYTIFGLF